MIGEVCGKYEVIRRIGSGGMGDVFAAKHTMLASEAAIKVLADRLTDNDDAVQRFFREAIATTAIKHPGIVQIYDYGETSTGSF